MKFLTVLTTLVASSLIASTQTLRTDSLKYEVYMDVFVSSTLNGDKTDIPYTTQTVVNSRPVINLFMAKSSYSYSNYEINVALQAGEYPVVNYVNQDRDVRFIQGLNAAVYSNSRKISLQVGILPSHVGYAGTVSRDNINVTSSLISDFTPYYQAGAKVQYSHNGLTAAMLVLQGWQNIFETNLAKSFGSAVKYATDDFAIAWNTIIGADDVDNEFYRYYNNMYAAYTSGNVTVVGLLDVCPAQGKLPTLYAGVYAQYRLNGVNIGLRYENVNDRDNVIFYTLNGESFIAQNYSLNVDYRLTDKYNIRLEYRHTSSPNAIFQSNAALLRYLTVSTNFTF